eukprot:gene5007-10016_t
MRFQIRPHITVPFDLGLQQHCLISADGLPNTIHETTTEYERVYIKECTSGQLHTEATIIDVNDDPVVELKQVNQVLMPTFYPSLSGSDGSSVSTHMFANGYDNSEDSEESIILETLKLKMESKVRHTFLPDTNELLKLRNQRQEKFSNYNNNDDNDNDNDWNFKYDLLLEYKRQYGHCNIPTSVIAYFSHIHEIKLGGWLRNQRRVSRYGELKPQRLEKLQLLVKEGSLSLNPDDDSWELHFKALLEYGESHHGDCNVPQGVIWTLSDNNNNNTGHCQLHHKRLGRWLEDQRHCKRIHRLKEDREKKLQMLVDRGRLSWDPDEEKWELYFEALQSYGELNGGDCNSPQSLEWTLSDGIARNLGVWLNRQRIKRRMNTLREDRMERLEALVDKGSLSWDPYEDSWDLHFESLLSYGESHNGDCNVPQSAVWISSDNKKRYIGLWLLSQRQYKKKNSLKRDRMERLQSLVDQGKKFYSHGAGLLKIWSIATS